MPKNDIGGFFVSLGLNADKDSFETGNKLVDTVANSFNKLIGAARNASVALAGTATVTGMVESSAYKTAEKIGISTEALDLWKASAKIAGVDANGLISAMGKLATVMGRMRIDGAGLEQFVKQLGELGLVADKVDIAKMLDMAPDELMTEIIRMAQEASAKAQEEAAEANKALQKSPNDADAKKRLKNARKEQQRISIIVGDILGDAGQDFYLELNRQGKTINEFLEGANRTRFTTAADNQKGADFVVEVNTLKTELESMGKLLGDSIGGELKQPLKDINNWLIENKESIVGGIDTIADIIGKIYNAVHNLKKDIDVYQDETGTGEVQAAIEVGARRIPGMNAYFAVQDYALWKLGYYTDNQYEALKNANTASLGKVNAPAKEQSGRKDADDYGSLTDYAEEPESDDTGASTFGAYRNRNKNAQTETKVLGAEPRKSPVLVTEEQTSKQTITTPKIGSQKQEKKKGFFASLIDSFNTKQTEESETNPVAKINDGIMRPDGTVTQVAPDDWVFAARNVGDIAKAFVPQNIVPEVPAVNIVQPEQRKIPTQDIGMDLRSEKTNMTTTTIINKLTPDYKKDIMPDTILNDLTAYIKSLSTTFIPKVPVQNTVPSEYVINQTINVSGSNDMPQILKQQAYKGTQNGLLQLMQQSSRRLQLMSGMR